MEKNLTFRNLLKEFLKKNADGRKVLILFILTNAVYAIMLLITIPEVMRYSGGLELPDMMPGGYSADHINELMKAMGEKGREYYLYKQIPLDMIYPFLFGITYSLLLAYLLNKLDKSENALFFFCYVPLFAGLFDYFENAGIIYILISFPENRKFISEITSIFTILKSTLSTVSFIVLIISLIAFSIKLVSRKR